MTSKQTPFKPSSQGTTSAIPPSHTKAVTRKDPLPSEMPDAGMRPSDGEQRVQAAFAASNRTEASLSSLMRAVQALTTGVSGAREANVQLVRELELLREMVANANEQQLAMKNRLAALERALEQAQETAAKERNFLVEQHDSFISGLIEDHETVVAELTRELEEMRQRARSSRPPALPSSPGNSRTEAELREQLEAAQRGIDKLVGERDRARDTLLRLQAQRDEAQASVAQISRERDQARADLAQFKIQQGLSEAIRSGNPLQKLPPAQASARITSPARTVSSPASTPRPASSPATSSAPPEDPRTTVTRPAKPSNSPAGAPSAPKGTEPPPSPPLKLKPDPSTRPLVGYSLTETAEERVDTSRITSTRPPQR